MGWFYIKHHKGIMNQSKLTHIYVFRKTFLLLIQNPFLRRFQNELYCFILDKRFSNYRLSFIVTYKKPFPQTISQLNCTGRVFYSLTLKTDSFYSFYLYICLD